MRGLEIIQHLLLFTGSFLAGQKIPFMVTWQCFLKVTAGELDF